MNNTTETNSTLQSSNNKPFNVIKGAELLRELQDRKHEQDAKTQEPHPFELEMLAATNDGFRSQH